MTNSGSETLETDIEDNEYICLFYTNQEFYLCVIDGYEEYSNIVSISSSTTTDDRLAYVDGNENFYLIVSATGSKYVTYSGSIIWWLDPIHYEIVLDKNCDDGETITMEDLEYDQTYTLTTNTFTRDGYTFLGWNTEADGSGTSYTDEAEIKNLTTTDGDVITLYAQWAVNTYTIEFDGNGADDGEMESISATYGEEYTLTSNTYTRDGYTFLDWNTEADGSGTSYTDGAEISNLTTTDGDVITLYAQWAVNTYTIEFDGNGADDGEMESISATYGEEYTLISNTYTRDGYTFLGWNTEADGSGTFYKNEENVSNLTTEDGVTITLYAQWAEDTEINVSITITKVELGDEENVLEGVEFSLYQLICEDESHTHNTDEDIIDIDDYDETCWELVDEYITDENGEFTLSDLLITENYRLIETKTLSEYLLPSGQWIIEFDYGQLDENNEDVIDYNGTSMKITGIGTTLALSYLNETLYLYNSTGYDLPTTGLLGISDYIVIGLIIFLIGIISKMYKNKNFVSILGINTKHIQKMNMIENKNICNINKLTHDEKYKHSKKQKGKHFK